MLFLVCSAYINDVNDVFLKNMMVLIELSVSGMLDIKSIQIQTFTFQITCKDSCDFNAK